MSITLLSLYDNSKNKYNLKIEAGVIAMSNFVQWVHTVEDVEVSGFLHGGELVFSTGIANKGKDWLMPFIKNLILKKVSGLVLNIGPYIPEIPNDIIDFCNEMGFPLLSIPWESRIVDITRDCCNMIIINEREENDISYAMKNIVFFSDNIEQYIPVLESHNFDIKTNYCMVAVKVIDNTHYGIYKVFERLLYSIKKHWSKFSVDEVQYYVLCGFDEKEIEQVIMSILSEYSGKIYFAVGSFESKVESLSKEYKTISKLIVFVKNKKIPVSYYDKLGIMKILLEIGDTEILKEFYQKYLSKLKSYDDENDTNYMNFLKLYLEFDGSINKVAEKTYVHRNTINYQLAKIKKILGNDLKTYNDKFNIMLAFYIG